MNYPKTYMLSTRVFLDTFNQCYKNIIVINLPPDGPLGKIVRRLQMPPLSPFNVPGPCCNRTGYKDCALALFSLRGCNGFGIGIENGNSGGRGNCLMYDDEVPDLFSFLLSNGYKIDTSLTKMMNQSEVKINDNKILCFITYNHL
jgi:hypothetical protein